MQTPMRVKVSVANELEIFLQFFLLVSTFMAYCVLPFPLTVYTKILPHMNMHTARSAKYPSEKWPGGSRKNLTIANASNIDWIVTNQRAKYGQNISKGVIKRSYSCWTTGNILE